jgi:hypothetical protein
VLVQKPQSDVYVALLAVALGAMVLACLLLLLVWWRYDFKTKAEARLDQPHAAFAAVLEQPAAYPRATVLL